MRSDGEAVPNDPRWIDAPAAAPLRSLRLPFGADVARLPPRPRVPRLPALGPRSERLLARVRAMRLRNRLTVLAAVPLVAIGGWLLLRDSSLFSVDRRARSRALGADALPVVSDAAAGRGALADDDRLLARARCAQRSRSTR